MDRGGSANEVRFLRDVNIVDVRTGSITEGANVSIEEGSIRSISADGNVGQGSDAKGLELTANGLYVLPGLIDMHAHLAYSPALIRMRAGVVSVGTRIATHLAEALRAGVTTVRDLGSPGDSGLSALIAWRERMHSGVLVGARPIFAGGVITSVGGHGAWAGTEVETMAEAKGAVADRHRKGHRWVKFMMASAARPIEFTAVDLAEVVEFAHGLGMRTAVHANFSEVSVLAAARAHCSTIEHGYAVTNEVLQSLVTSRTALCPTLTALHSVAANPEIARVRVGAELVVQATANLDRARSAVHRYREAGVAIVAGTDAGVIGVRYGDIHTELRLLRECGLSALEALQAATVTAADVLGEPIGAVEPGRKADLLIVRANPLKDPDTLVTPESIILEGQLVDPIV